MKKINSLHNGSTLFLKFVIALFGLFVLFLLLFVLPAGLRSENVGYYRPLLMGMYVPALPFFLGLYQGFKILNLVDHNKIFSAASVTSLRVITYCGIAIAGMYALGLPYIFSVAQRDDAPGVFLLGCIFVIASGSVAIGSSIFKNMLSSVVDMKSENDLTV